MNSKKDYQFFKVRRKTLITGKIVAKNEDIAESDFHKDIVNILKSHGYTVKIVSEPKISKRTKT